MGGLENIFLLQLLLTVLSKGLFRDDRGKPHFMPLAKPMQFFFFVDRNVAALSFMGDRGGRSCSCVSFNDRTLRHHFTTSTLGIYLQVYTFKSIISSIGVILFIEVSKRTLMSLW